MLGNLKIGADQIAAVNKNSTNSQIVHFTSVTLTGRNHLQPVTYFSLEDWSAVHRSGDSLWFDDRNGDGFISLYVKIIVVP